MTNQFRKPQAEKARTQTTIRLSADLSARLKRLAELQRTSSTAVIEQCLVSGMPRLEKLFQEFLEGRDE